MCHGITLSREGTGVDLPVKDSAIRRDVRTLAAPAAVIVGWPGTPRPGPERPAAVSGR